MKPDADRVTNVAADSSVLDDSRQELRFVLTRLFDVMYPVGVIIGGIALVASVFQSVHYGWSGKLFVNLGMYLLAVVLLVFRRRIPVALIFAALIGLIGLDVVQCLFTMGLASSATMSLALLCIFVSVFLGLRAGIVAASAGVFVTLLIGAGVCTGIIIIRSNVTDILLEPTSWIVRIALFVTYVVPLIIAVDGMKKRMMQNIHELKEANETLRAEILMRRTTEKELRKSEEKYRSIYENAVEGIFQTKPDGHFISANPALAYIHGYISPDEMMNTITDLGEQLYVDKDRRYEFVRLINEEGVVSNFEAQTYRKDGSTTWISINARNVRDEKGITLYYEGTIENITERKCSEEALKESEKRFREFADLLPQTVVEFDGMGNVTFANRNAFETFKYTKEDLGKGVNLLQLVIPEDRDRTKENIKKIMKENNQTSSSRNEYTAMRKDGSLFYVAAYTSPVIRENRPVGFRSIVIDVTEQKKTDNALRMSEARLRQIIDLVPHFIFAKDRSGRFVLVNKSVADAYGTTVENLVGKTDSDFNHSRDEIEGFLSDDLEVMDSGKPKDIPEEKITDSKGNIRFLNTTKIPFTLSMTDSDAVLGVSIDITAHKQMEEALKESVSIFEGLAGQPLVGIYLIQDGLFRYANPAFAAMHGYQPEEMIDKLGPMETVAPEDKEKVSELLTRKLKDESMIFECHIIQKDGTRREIESFSTGISYNGSPAILGILLDVAERKRLEAQLIQAQKMESIGTLTGGIAHDFNNILSAVMGYSALLQMKMDKANPLRSYVDQVLLASKKAANLVRSLLVFSRKQPLVLAPLDVNDTIKEAEKLLKKLLTEDIEMFVSPSHNSTVIMADKTQMDQILFNLASNARDAMPKGGRLNIETDITTIDSNFIRANGFGKSGIYVQIKVSDTGTGMNEATLEKIFDPFFTTKGVGRGTGLGLATVYGIVKQHNGYITVDSEPNQGTTFRIYLPAVTTEVDLEEDSGHAIKMGSETILIAEDDEEVRCFIREALQEHGYKTIEATDGEDAIYIYKLHRDIDLIVFDLVMPKKNGREAYEEIHKMQPNAKALFISGYTNDIILDKGIGENEFDFITKPLLLDKFLSKIREMLDR